MVPEKKLQILFVTLTFLLTACNKPASELSYADVVNDMTDLKRLAVIPVEGESCAQWSSYDRKSKYDPTQDRYIDWQANGDANGYIRMEDSAFVLAEMKGPGAIVRIWSAQPEKGHVKIYIDGNETPAVDLPFEDYFSRKTAPFNFPGLVYEAARGFNSYVPITYQKSCKVVAEKGWGLYYHFTYMSFPENTRVEPFSMNPGPGALSALHRVNDFFIDSLGYSPYSSSPEDSTISGKVTIGPGQSAVLADIKGEYAVKSFKIYPHFDGRPDEFSGLRKLVLRMKWDGETEPSVWSPLGDFFGTTPAINPYKTLPLGMDSSAFYSYWYMPFQKQARVEIENSGSKSYDIGFKMVIEKPSKPVSQLARFHAKWHSDLQPVREDRIPDWTLLQTEGQGRFVGVMLHVMNPNGELCATMREGAGGWWGEGDEKFFVDGEKFPGTFGTGSEDYFGYAWGEPRLFHKAYHAQTMNTYNTTHQTLDRWQIMDNIPFHKSFDGSIEKYNMNACGTRYNCVVYWYLAPGGSDPLKPQDITVDSVVMPPIITPAEDINVPGKTIEVTIDGKGVPVHYTTDGSDPEKNSALYNGPLTIRKNTVLRARAFGSDGSISMVSNGEYHFVSPVAAMKPASSPKPGLSYRYYEHQWTMMPDFSEFTPVDSGITPKVVLGMQKAEDHFGIVFNGYVKLPVDGLYTFYLNSDDGSILYIDGIKVVDNDRCHGAYEVSARYPFQAGYHKVRLEYFDNELYQELKFSYSAPGIKKQEVGEEMLFH